jgi:hypothetical protein
LTSFFSSLFLTKLNREDCLDPPTELGFLGVCDFPVEVFEGDDFSGESLNGDGIYGVYFRGEFIGITF